MRETLRFMFLSRRRHLIKRLWKLRVREPHEAAGTLAEGEGCYGALDFLKKLEENQLAMLLAAVESRGADLSACVLLPRDTDCPTACPPHVLSCRVWRWPNLQHDAQVRRLPGCLSAHDPVYICCNPYHWSRLCELGKYNRSFTCWNGMSSALLNTSTLLTVKRHSHLCFKASNAVWHIQHQQFEIPH